MSDGKEEEVADISFSLPNKEKAEAFKAKLRELGYSVFDPPPVDPEMKKNIQWFVEEPPETDEEYVTINCTPSEMQNKEFNEKLEKLGQKFDATYDGSGMCISQVLSPELFAELSPPIVIVKPVQ